MNHTLLAFAFLATQVVFTEACFGQDPLAEHKINGLKGFGTLAVVVRPNTPLEIASPKEWRDMVELGLRRHAPELRILDTKNTPTWLELSVITTDIGGFLELSIYRRVRVLDSGEETFSKVWWDSRAVFGGVSKKSLQDSSTGFSRALLQITSVQNTRVGDAWGSDASVNVIHVCGGRVASLAVII
jgi:hypothetical protein